MGALEIAQGLGKKEALDKIRTSGLREHGVYHGPVAEKLKEGADKSPIAFIAGALNNEDTERMLLSILKENPSKVFEGLAVAAYITDAKEMLLYLPDGSQELQSELEEMLKGQGRNIKIVIGMADARMLSDGLVIHLETLYLLPDVLEDAYVPGGRICIKHITEEGIQYSQPVFAREESTLKQEIGEILPEMDSFEIKAVWMGHKLYDASILSEKITEETNFGNGVVTIFDKGICMVKAAEEILLSSLKAACGKCTFCREGMHQLYTRLHETTAGKGDLSGLDIMEEIAKAMEFSTLCSMGQTGGMIVRETLEQFSGEYTDHIKRKRCTAGTCPAFINVYIAPDKCTGCGACILACPENCIEGMPGYIHMVEDIDCTKCGKCQKACEAGAIVKTVDKVPLLPDRLTRTGRFKRY